MGHFKKLVKALSLILFALYCGCNDPTSGKNAPGGDAHGFNGYRPAVDTLESWIAGGDGFLVIKLKGEETTIKLPSGVQAHQVQAAHTTGKKGEIRIEIFVLSELKQVYTTSFEFGSKENVLPWIQLTSPFPIIRMDLMFSHTFGRAILFGLNDYDKRIYSYVDSDPSHPAQWKQVEGSPTVVAFVALEFKSMGHASTKLIALTRNIDSSLGDPLDMLLIQHYRIAFDFPRSKWIIIGGGVKTVTQIPRVVSFVGTASRSGLESLAVINPYGDSYFSLFSANGFSSHPNLSSNTLDAVTIGYTQDKLTVAALINGKVHFQIADQNDEFLGSWTPIESVSNLNTLSFLKNGL